ncbi:phosphate ABC transporter permease subunit PstC [Halogeometricum limi]|uniref:Phosphate transport system permease protein n=1 Tax=Halogeometricum limi TaxID=555875 RepID=A0A1I6HEV7_9EURY|nr:phosphate ABC transporter permease subunit PstC [Halogeometricum limi]SFR52979.1 phosphate transport system permease protein [Halogeometricum limi]
MAESSLKQSFDTFRAAEDIDASALLAGAVGVVFLLTALTSFVLRLGLEVPAIVGFVVVLGYGWYAHQGLTAKAVTFLMTVSTVLILGMITVFLVLESLHAFRLMGVNMLVGMDEPVTVFGVTVLPGLGNFWQPSSATYSLVPAMWGTFVTTLIATAVAAPLGVACALFLAEIAPNWAREIVKPGIEILAGIPSIVYGFIGFTVLNTYVFQNFQTPSQGSFFLVGGVIGVMALPTVVSVAEDSLDTVPDSMKDGALALGSTDWQTMTSITLPAAFSGVSAAVLLGVGRAIGETMAATVILGNTVGLPQPLYDVFGNNVTLTTLIASQYGDAGETQLSALFAAGVVLFVTVLFLSLTSLRIEAKLKQELSGD